MYFFCRKSVFTPALSPSSRQARNRCLTSVGRLVGSKTLRWIRRCQVAHVLHCSVPRLALFGRMNLWIITEFIDSYSDHQNFASTHSPKPSNYYIIIYHEMPGLSSQTWSTIRSKMSCFQRRLEHRLQKVIQPHQSQSIDSSLL